MDIHGWLLSSPPDTKLTFPNTVHKIATFTVNDSLVYGKYSDEKFFESNELGMV